MVLKVTLFFTLQTFISTFQELCLRKFWKLYIFKEILQLYFIKDILFNILKAVTACIASQEWWLSSEHFGKIIGVQDILHSFHKYLLSAELCQIPFQVTGADRAVRNTDSGQQKRLTERISYCSSVTRLSTCHIQTLRSCKAELLGSTFFAQYLIRHKKALLKRGLFSRWLWRFSFFRLGPK